MQTGRHKLERKLTSSVEVSLSICAEEFVHLYSGSVKNVSCMAADGRRILFPGDILKPFVTQEGVVGRFKIDFDAQMRFVKIEQMR